MADSKFGSCCEILKDVLQSDEFEGEGGHSRLLRVIPAPAKPPVLGLICSTARTRAGPGIAECYAASAARRWAFSIASSMEPTM